MKKIFDDVSLSCSMKVTSTYSTSFSLAVRLLSPATRDGIHAVYGFVRLADEIVDSFQDYDQFILFTEFEKELENAITRKISMNPILNSFQEVVHRYNIDRKYIDAFMNSMRADLYKSIYNNSSEYEQYIYGSADVVGLMCLKIFVEGDQHKFDELEGYARRLGSAFQKVNFLRDLKDDSGRLNRNYFHHFTTGSNNNSAKEKIISEIRDDFEEAFKGISRLPIGARLGVYTAYIYYKKLLSKLSNTPLDRIRSERIRISNPVKIGLLAQSFVRYKLNKL